MLPTRIDHNIRALILGIEFGIEFLSLGIEFGTTLLHLSNGSNRAQNGYDHLKV